MEEYGIKFTENQLKKLSSAVYKKTSVSIRLKNDQLKGKHKILLTHSQIEQIIKAKRLKVGVTLNFAYDQLKANHVGGFLPLLFAGLAAVGTFIGGAAGGGAAIASAIHNKQAHDDQLKEEKRHNMVMEELNKKIGRGLKKNKKNIILNR